MEVIFFIILLVTHFIAFLAGKSIKSNKEIDRIYPDYKRLKEAEDEKNKPINILGK